MQHGANRAMTPARNEAVKEMPNKKSLDIGFDDKN